MKNNEQACFAQPRREATANQLNQAREAATTVSVANYVINTAAIGIFGSKTSSSEVFLPLPRGEGWGEGRRTNHANAQSLGTPPVSREDVYLRPTIGQSPCKFFEITRDGGSSELEAVSTRLPKNFQCNRPTVSASSAALLHHALTTNSVANYPINTATIGIFSPKTAVKSSSEATLTTKAPQTLQSSLNKQLERSGSAERGTGFTSRSAHAGALAKTLQTEVTTNSVANYLINTAAIGIFGSKKAVSKYSEPVQPRQLHPKKALPQRSTKPVFTLDNKGLRAPTPALMFRAQHETCGEAQTTLECGCLHGTQLRYSKQNNLRGWQRRKQVQVERMLDKLFTSKSIANYLINAEAIGVFDTKKSFKSNSEATPNTKTTQTLRNLLSTHHACGVHV